MGQHQFGAEGCPLITNMNGITLQFSTTSGLVSRFIRAFTWSDYSHVDIVLPDGTLLGAARDGVKIRPAGYHKFSKVQRYFVEGAPADKIYELAKSQVGKPYDFMGIVNFGWHSRDWKEDDSWFCSELVAWAFMKAGFPLLDPDTPINRITPRDLTLSTRMVEI